MTLKNAKSFSGRDTKFHGIPRLGQDIFDSCTFEISPKEILAKRLKSLRSQQVKTAVKPSDSAKSRPTRNLLYFKIAAFLNPLISYRPIHTHSLPSPLPVLRIPCLILMMTFAAVGLLRAGSAAQIFELHSYSQEYPWTQSQQAGFIETLSKDPRVKISVITEYMDTKRRVYDPSYADDLERHLRIKYAGYKPALIYVTDDNALIFARDHLVKVFPGTPVFFSGINDYGLGSSLDPGSFTGVFEVKEVAPNISWLRELDKNANDLIFVGDGSNTYQAVEAQARKDLPATGLRSNFIAETRLDRALEQVRKLPGKYIFLTTVGGMTDVDGQVLPLRDILRSFVQTGRTVVSMEDGYVTEGVLGGWVTSGRNQGESAAGLAFSHLLGKPVSELPAILKSPNALLFDDSVLEKAGITLPQELSAKAVLQNPRLGSYERYHVLITYSLAIFAGILFLLVTGTIVILSQRNRELRQARAAAELAETVQREALDHLQKIASRVPGVVYQYRLRPDGSSYFPFASEGIREIYQVSPEEVREDAAAVFARIYPEDLAEVTSAIQASARKLIPWKQEYRVKFDDGTIRVLFGNAVPQREKDGSVLWHGFISDITERKQSEGALVKTAQRLTLATRAAGVGIWEFDIAEGKLTWDDQMFRLYGIARTDFGETYEAWKNAIHPDDRQRTDEEIQMALSGEKDFDTEFRVVCPDGEIRNIRALSTLQRDAAGHPLQMLGTNWDITALKQVNEQLQKTTLLANQMASEARAASLAKSAFLAAMSHEIRTPLNGILGSTEILSRSELKESQNELMHIILTSGDLLLSTINNILDFSKIEAGQIALENVDFSLLEEVGKVIQVVTHAARKKDISLTFVADPKLPACVRGDVTRLRQILVNLAGNAIKFTEQGSVTIFCESLASGRIHFKVTDTGIGIPTEKLTILFEPFTQADSSTTRKYGGSGLGLAISHRLVEIMGGELRVDSTPGAGSCFSFDLLLPVAEASLLVREPITTHGEDRHSENSTRVLLAEDNEVNCKITVMFLKSLGVTNVSLASNGQEAVDLWMKEPFDLVLMDCQMPVMDGHQATRLIREHEQKTDAQRRQTIIGLSAGAMVEDRRAAIASGMDDYLSKPIKRNNLAQCLDHWGNSSSSHE